MMDHGQVKKAGQIERTSPWLSGGHYSDVLLIDQDNLGLIMPKLVHYLKINA